MARGRAPTSSFDSVPFRPVPPRFPIHPSTASSQDVEDERNELAASIRLEIEVFIEIADLARLAARVRQQRAEVRPAARNATANVNNA